MNVFYPDYDAVQHQRHTEHIALRSAAGFVGALMLALTVSMQFAYTLIALFLVVIGFLPPNALAQEQLGLDNTTYLLVYAGVYFVAMGAPLLLTIGRKRLFSFKPARRPITGAIGFCGVLGAVGVCMGANIITSILMTVLEQWGIPIPEMPDMMVNTPISYLLNVFVIAVLPAILEEALFRGCVLRVLRPYGDWFAVFVSAALFGLMHGNVRQIPFAIIVGLILGWLYVATNSIILPMVVHFANNALSVTMDYCSFYLSESKVGFFFAIIIYGLTVVGMLCLLVLLITNRSRLKLNATQTCLQTGERISTLFKSPAFVISILVFIVLACLELIV